MPWYRQKVWVTERGAKTKGEGRHTPGVRIEYTREFRAKNKRAARKETERFAASAKKHTLGVSEKERWHMAVQRLDGKPRRLRGRHVSKGPVARRVVYHRKGRTESYEGKFLSLHTLRKGEVREVRTRSRRAKQ